MRLSNKLFSELIIVEKIRMLNLSIRILLHQNRDGDNDD